MSSRTAYRSKITPQLGSIDLISSLGALARESHLCNPLQSEVAEESPEVANNLSSHRKSSLLCRLLMEIFLDAETGSSEATAALYPG